MAKLTMILGGSGQGKSSSLSSLDPSSTMLIKAIRKDLPFRAAKDWVNYDKNTQKGNVWVTDKPAAILKLIKLVGGTKSDDKDPDLTHFKRIVIDDFQYSMANEFMRRADEKSYDKWNDIGAGVWNIIKAASDLPDNVRVYVLWHPDYEDDGREKAKTVGKITDRYVTPEGYFLCVLKAFKGEDGKGYFETNSNSPLFPYKSPPEMLELVIPNDLKFVDEKICEYYGIK